MADLADLVEADEGFGEQPYPVFVPRDVLAQAHDLKDQAGGVETGGILIGYLWQDPGTRAPFGEVTQFLPARHTKPDKMRLTFTPDTWADFRATISLRGRGEAWLGWLHSHPARFWCSCQEAEKQIDCPWSGDFFSNDDCVLHGTVFSGAQHVAVVLGDRFTAATGWETTYAAFGWHNGLIETRAFHVLAGDSLLHANDKGAEIVTTY